jgi:BMFP domain-containing protein YqiC
MPTANEIEKNGADLGELNRILVEKVEELTLYILELEARLSEVESDDTSTNSEENALLEERINRLEALLEQMKK